jgi:hypothetical protein
MTNASQRRQRGILAGVSCRLNLLLVLDRRWLIEQVCVVFRELCGKCPVTSHANGEFAYTIQWNVAIGGDAAETGAGPGSYDIRQSVWHVNVSYSSSQYKVQNFKSHVPKLPTYHLTSASTSSR